MKPPKPLGKGYKSITVVLKAPCFYVNLVKAPRPDLNLKAARLQHGGLQTQSIHIYILIYLLRIESLGGQPFWKHCDLDPGRSELSVPSPHNIPAPQS